MDRERRIYPAPAIQTGPHKERRLNKKRKRVGCRMVLAYHVIFGTYGFWLPNDPRGSWSDFVGAFELFIEAGKATTTTTRRSVAASDHDRAARLRATAVLRRPEVRLTGLQARSAGQAFRARAQR